MNEYLATPPLLWTNIDTLISMHEQAELRSLARYNRGNLKCCFEKMSDVLVCFFRVWVSGASLVMLQKACSDVIIG